MPQVVDVPAVQPASTKRMVERLEAEWRKAAGNPMGAGAYMSAELADHWRFKIETEPDPRLKLPMMPNLSVQLLNAGKSEEALQVIEQFEEEAQKLGVRVNTRYQTAFTMHRALCYLRLGEQENCLTNHNADSCLLPIQGGGIHRLPRGSQGAVELLTAHLRDNRDDLQARWLLNIAHMTLGDYPDKVAPEWRIDPRVFESEYDIKRFPQMAAEAGLDVDGLAGGGIVEDFDGDGYLDVMASAWDLKGQLRIFRNEGDGRFTERTDQAGLTGLVGALNLMQTDYNNDGHPDVFIPRGAWLGAGGHHPNSLLRNNGNGTFTDVTEEAGLLSFHPTQTATWFDFNGDGWLDIFIGNETTGNERHACELFRNNRDGSFTECAAEAGLAVEQFIKGVTSGDFNRDGRPDLYLSNRTGPNLLFRNDGPQGVGGNAESPWKFTEVTAEAGVAGPDASFPTWFWDYDNDGWPDIMVTGYGTKDVGDVAADYLGLPHSAERARLYRNNQDGTFTDITRSAGLYRVLHAMGANYGDLDNDGWLDFYVGTGEPHLSTLIPNRMFRNDGGRRFQDVTTSGGFGHLQKGHGVSFADLDNDGDQDVHIQMGGAYTGDTARNALFLNPGHGNNWITLKLEGVTSNRAGVGARIRVVVQTPEGDRSIYKTTGTGASFGASPLRQEIGLGNAQGIRLVEVFWPVTGMTQSFPGLEMNRFYKIREDSATATPWPLKSFVLTPALAEAARPAGTGRSNKPGPAKSAAGAGS